MIATGETHTVRECVEVAFDEAGLGDWEQLRRASTRSFLRPAEVDLLIGDPSKAKRELGLGAADELRGADPPDDPGRPRAPLALRRLGRTLRLLGPPVAAFALAQLALTVAAVLTGLPPFDDATWTRYDSSLYLTDRLAGLRDRPLPAALRRPGPALRDGRVVPGLPGARRGALPPARRAAGRGGPARQPGLLPGHARRAVGLGPRRPPDDRQPPRADLRRLLPGDGLHARRLPDVPRRPGDPDLGRGRAPRALAPGRRGRGGGRPDLPDRRPPGPGGGARGGSCGAATAPGRRRPPRCWPSPGPPSAASSPWGSSGPGRDRPTPTSPRRRSTTTGSTRPGRSSTTPRRGPSSGATARARSWPSTSWPCSA